ncbi:MAG: CARDB domain-containing protein [Candidatus Bathyarchaeota archaeon]|jgi:methionine-rich copper-binding protein CopC|nr:CARDB domain-containing protein [Candidatus Bathyarchaeota archaeon]
MRFKSLQAAISLFLVLTLVILTPHTNAHSTLDAAIIDVTPSTNKAYVGETVAINVTVKNNGTESAEFSVTTFFGNLTDNYTIATLKTGQLEAGEEKILTFNWDTSNVKPCQNYTIKANCTVDDDPTPEDNELVDGEVKISILADIDGDGKVDIQDLVLLVKAFGSDPEHPRWNQDADLNNNEKVDIIDLIIMLKNYGKMCESP